MNSNKLDITLEIEPSQALRLGTVLEQLSHALQGGGQEQLDADFLRAWANHFTLYGIAKIAATYMSDANETAFFKDIETYQLGVIPPVPVPPRCQPHLNGVVKVV